MNAHALFIAGRILVPIVFIGLGLERLLIAGGVMAGPPVSTGAVAFSVFELVAGLLIAVGWQVRWVALLLALFIVVDAFLAHPFWSFAAEERHAQLLHFLKNFSTLGGLLLLIWAGGARAKSGRA